MADLLWQKPGVEVDARIQAFLAGDDVLLDREFFLHDIAASQAHAQGLQRIGILSAGELADIARELEVLAADFRGGSFVLDARHEDGHSAIEARLVERLGDTGRRIHTGRSRNDQVLVATRLWLKDKLAQLRATTREVAGIALERAEAEASLPMPGYSHLQRAVVSSAGMWWGGWAEAFIDDAIHARVSRARMAPMSAVSASISPQNGISRELKNPALPNADIDGSNWSDASTTAVYGPGGRGTPGARNSGFTP